MGDEVVLDALICKNSFQPNNRSIGGCIQKFPDCVDNEITATTTTTTINTR